MFLCCIYHLLKKLGPRSCTSHSNSFLTLIIVPILITQNDLCINTEKVYQGHHWRQERAGEEQRKFLSLGCLFSTKWNGKYLSTLFYFSLPIIIWIIITLTFQSGNIEYFYCLKSDSYEVVGLYLYKLIIAFYSLHVKSSLKHSDFNLKWSLLLLILNLLILFRTHTEGGGHCCSRNVIPGGKQGFTLEQQLS